MKLLSGPYFFFFFWLATVALWCRAQQPDSDMYALFYSKRSSGGDSTSSKRSSDGSTSALLFGNIAEELQRTSALQTELRAVRKALDATSSQDSSLRRRVKSAKKYSNKHAKKYTKKYSYYSSDYYSSKSYKSKSTKKKYKESELEQCQAELAKHQNEVSYLFIQTASACQVQRNGTSYKMVTDSISEDTYVFSDRPYRIEGTVPTANFSAAWSDMFQTSNPNVGVTLVSNDNEAVGPLVVVFSEPDYQDNGQLAYNIEQSPNQDGVKSIESIFDGTSLMPVSFESCSFFIDAVRGDEELFNCGNLWYASSHPSTSLCYDGTSPSVGYYRAERIANFTGRDR